MAVDIMAELQKYGKATDEIVVHAIENVGKAGLRMIRESAPRRTGAYARSWALSPLQKDGSKYGRRLYARAPHYRLTHLLEDGHAIVKQGRTVGESPAIPHIGPVSDYVSAELEREIIEGIRRNG